MRISNKGLGSIPLCGLSDLRPIFLLCQGFQVFPKVVEHDNFNIRIVRKKIRYFNIFYGTYKQYSGSVKMSWYRVLPQPPVVGNKYSHKLFKIRLSFDTIYLDRFVIL